VEDNPDNVIKLRIGFEIKKLAFNSGPGGTISGYFKTFNLIIPCGLPQGEDMIFPY